MAYDLSTLPCPKHGNRSKRCTCVTKSAMLSSRHAAEMAVESAEMARRLAKRERQLYRRERKLRKLQKALSDTDKPRHQHDNAQPSPPPRRNSSKEKKPVERAPKPRHNQSPSSSFPSSTSGLTSPNASFQRHASVNRQFMSQPQPVYNPLAPRPRPIPRSSTIPSGLRARAFANPVPRAYGSYPLHPSRIPRAVSLPYGVSSFARRPYPPNRTPRPLFL